MRRFVGLALATQVLLTACSPALMDPRPIDAACRAHAAPADCQAALEVGLHGLGIDRTGYVVVVEAVTCAEGRCTTWVSAVPDADDDCVPSYDAELAREALGPWTVVMSSHGDPPCAFEP
ncbi:MAG: hypothetical protein ACRDG7_02590 [Candidatus Limnocylindria bacterium]